MFPGEALQIWEGSAVHKPLVSTAPQEAAVLAAPLPAIEISCLSLTNPLLFHWKGLNATVNSQACPCGYIQPLKDQSYCSSKHACVLCAGQTQPCLRFTRILS